MKKSVDSCLVCELEWHGEDYVSSKGTVAPLRFRPAQARLSLMESSRTFKRTKSEAC